MINKKYIDAFNDTLNEYEPDLLAFTSTSIPYTIVENLIKGIRTETLNGLIRTFQLYMRLPEWLDPVIKLAEKADSTGKEVYKVLHKIVQHKIDESVKPV
jgi:hypothetical protein|tara:strand:- start:174 stop:473 length:300 start_codon:yes stop_codon:yes gene_type:complete